MGIQRLKLTYGKLATHVTFKQRFVRSLQQSFCWGEPERAPH